MRFKTGEQRTRLMAQYGGYARAIVYGSEYLADRCRHNVALREADPAGRRRIKAGDWRQYLADVR